MPRFRQTPEILKVMGRKENIRNVGIVAHIDHGKTTMTDSLLIEAGLLPPQLAGSARVLDYLKEEQKRGITIKTANISLLHEADGSSFVINLVDTPGHVDFTGKVTRALRAIDGVVVVVDAAEEIMAQTETVTRQALEERVKPVLFINKIDRLIKEMRLSPAEIQAKFSRIIVDFNNLIEIYAEGEFRQRWKVDPRRESVVFGSALHKWGFTLDIANRKGIKFSDRDIIEAYDKDKYQGLSRVIPLHTAILEMVVKNLPSPVESQKYRVPKIWMGKTDSEIGQAMLNCDDKGPIVMSITMAQEFPNVGLVVTGRVFSGSIREGDHVYLVKAGEECRVQQVSMYMGAFRETADQIKAGNIAALVGLDLARAGETLVDAAHKGLMVPFEPVKYISEPIMTVAVEPKNPQELPALVEAMKRLSVEDPNIVTTIDRETGQYLLSGMGELHLEVAINLLKQYAGEIGLTASNPITAYRESILKKGATVKTKSLNRHNSFWVQVEPLKDKALEVMEKGLLEERMRLGSDADVLKIEGDVWALDQHRNVLTDLTENVPNLQEVKESIVSGFHWACRSGPLCEEPLRGVKARLINVQLSEDPLQREREQIMRAVSRAILGSCLTGDPILLQPVFKIEVSAPTQWFGTCSSIITQRHGKIQTAEKKGSLTLIKGFISAANTLGLATEMRSATSGHAFWQCSFDHWEKVPKDMATKVIRKIRVERGLPSEIPKPEALVDEV